MTEDTQKPEGTDVPEQPDAAPQATEEEQNVAPEAATEPEAPQAPANLPKKFRCPVTGEPRWEALVNSYAALEKRLSQVSGPPQNDEERERLQRLLGKPESPQEYAVDLPPRPAHHRPGGQHPPPPLRLHPRAGARGV